MSKILPRFPQWISPRILLPVANLGEIPGKIALRFLPPWICSLARILGRFAVAFWRDFGHWDSYFSARILARFTAGSRRDFGRREFRFLARILPGSQRDSPREEKSQWSKSRRDPNRIPAEIAAGSCQDPGPYCTRDMAAWVLFPPSSKNLTCSRPQGLVTDCILGDRLPSLSEKQLRW